MLSNHNTLFNHQQGKVSLQTIFWIVGIIVGLLTIVQIVSTFVSDQSEQDNTQISVGQGDGTHGDEAGNEDISNGENSDNYVDKHQNGEVPKKTSPKSTALETASLKVDNYIAYDSGVVVDDTLGIMWMRCSLGQQWTGTDCEGAGLTYDSDHIGDVLKQFNVTGFAGFYDWQIPDIYALNSLVYCSEGFDDSYEIILESGKRQVVDTGCVSGHISPTIKSNVFPNTQESMLRGYLSTSINDEGKPLVVYFSTGQIKAKDNPQFIRLMRRMK